MAADVAASVFIVVSAIIGLAFAAFNALIVARVKLTGPSTLSYGGDAASRLTSHDALAHSEEGRDDRKALATMKEISAYIAQGANAFLLQEYKYMGMFMIVFAIIIGAVLSHGVAVMMAFILGVVTSIVCGFIGMRIAVFANVRTAHEAWNGLQNAFVVAFRSGAVMGFCLVSLGLINLFILICIYKAIFTDDVAMYEAIAGYGLGGSSVALFGRVGGGIYTKAADVGADLSGKNDFGMSEDDPRNPACIADNVGDNVGDIAGMGADLFGSFAESTCAALVIAANSPELVSNWAYMMFPLTITAAGILGCMVTTFVSTHMFIVRENPDIEKSLKLQLIVSTLIMTGANIGLCFGFLPDKFHVDGAASKPAYALTSILLGLWSGLIIGFITEYFTSHSYTPVREVATSQDTSAATGIIYGLALGYKSCIIPVICLAVTIFVSHYLTGMYGVALAALGMLSTLCVGLAIDGYGPISDNAGGIAEMSGLGPETRNRTDALDAAGNTTAAIGKGFAIGSAALVSLALFGAFTVRAGIVTVDIKDAMTFSGLLVGAMLPYAFSAMTMKSVGKAAEDMVKECHRQFPDIISGAKQPDYTRCVGISTQAAIKEMIAPGALVMLSPILVGIAFGRNAVAGLLSGALVSGIQMAISASNSGGAWDNAKKYIETGKFGGKGSAAHKNAVTGDTVGDPLKDTSGPALNILVKLMAIISLVFGSLISDTFSNKNGGPRWISA